MQPFPTGSSMLATGGLAAVVVAGWNQVKNVFKHISSLVIVQVDLDYTLSHSAYTYLRTNYKCVPSGLLNYRSKRLQFKDRNTTAIVPFRLPPRKTVYYRGKSIVFVSEVNNDLKIMTIRGLTNMNEFVSSAIDEYEARSSSSTKNESRFQVKKVIGHEKGFAALRSNHKSETVAEQASPDSNYDGPSMVGEPDLSVDISFKYDRSLYTFTKQDDPFDGLYFSPEVNKYFEQAKQWFAMGDWYGDRKIPWRRGWLLYGPGGTGKSSICKAVGQMLGIPIYQFFLATLSDQEFLREWDSMVTPCIALFEDFDTVFQKRESLTEHKSLTFDCVLNQISGVSAMNGVFLMVTTNHLENIDEAMGVSCGLEGISTRPGRIDTVIEVGMITTENRYKMAQKILRDWPEEIDSIVNNVDAENVTPIQFQEMCIQVAYRHLAEQLQ